MPILIERPNKICSTI